MEFAGTLARVNLAALGSVNGLDQSGFDARRNATDIVEDAFRGRQIVDVIMSNGSKVTLRQIPSKHGVALHQVAPLNAVHQIHALKIGLVAECHVRANAKLLAELESLGGLNRICLRCRHHGRHQFVVAPSSNGSRVQVNVGNRILLGQHRIGQQLTL